MTQISVQPKKKTSLLPWLLLLLGIGVVVWLIVKNKNAKEGIVATTQPATNKLTSGWEEINFNVPAVEYEEVSNHDVAVRGNNKYGIYSLGENILFDEGKYVIKPAAEENLKQIMASINKRYNHGNVRVYGFTDSVGSTEANKALAEHRAESVKAWLQGNGIDAARISVNAVGETRPVATNNTEQGRAQNRRVEIVARSKQD